jgi:hypothetical protein
MTFNIMGQCCDAECYLCDSYLYRIKQKNPLWYHYAECQYCECQYAECHYAGCHYAECGGVERQI